jgi:hypothetical protein
MTGTAQSNNPGGPQLVEPDRPPLRRSVGRVRELQRKLWAAAKQFGGRRFHALYDRVHRGDVVWEAWERVLRNKGAAGVDRITLAVVEEYGVGRMLDELARDLRVGSYRPVLVRYADGGVVLCRSAAQAGRALDAVGGILAGLGLQLHPGKTRIVDLCEGRAGFDFLGCHFRARMSGRLWQQRRVRRYYLHRWPLQRAMQRVREKVKARTGRNRAGGRDLRVVIEELDPILRGWGNYFRSGNAANKFTQVDDYVVWRLRRLMIKKRGRNLRAGQTRQWTQDWFNGLGLHRLRGTVRYPRAA